MIRLNDNPVVRSIEKYRYPYLLLSILLLLIIPAFIPGTVLSGLIFAICVSFLLIQSMISVTTFRTRLRYLKYIILFVLLILIWLEPAGYSDLFMGVLQLVFLVIFFGFIILLLLKFISGSSRVSGDVIITAINIYLLIGIIGGCLADLLYTLYPMAYGFPGTMSDPRLLEFIYFNFVTMSTLGYGDITPVVRETQTLSFLMAVTGQLYVAIIIAMLVGKYIVHEQKDK